MLKIFDHCFQGNEKNIYVCEGNAGKYKRIWALIFMASHFWYYVLLDDDEVNENVMLQSHLSHIFKEDFVRVENNRKNDKDE